VHQHIERGRVEHERHRIRRPEVTSKDRGKHVDGVAPEELRQRRAEQLRRRPPNDVGRVLAGLHDRPGGRVDGHNHAVRLSGTGDADGFLHAGFEAGPLGLGDGNERRRHPAWHTKHDGTPALVR